MIPAGKLGKIAWRIIRARALKRYVPVQVSYFASYKCNLSCLFCRRSQQQAEELSLAQACKMMERFRAAGTLIWCFNGGEPLLRPDLGELIKYSKQCGFYTTLITNGTLIENNIEAVRQIDHVDISIDGDEQVHDQIRGAGSYARTLKGLQILRKLKIDTSVMTVINKANIFDLQHLITLAQDYGCDIKFEPIVDQTQDQAPWIQALFPEKTDFRKTVDWLIQQKQKGRPIFSSTFYLKTIREYWPDAKNRIKCYAGKLHCRITPDGRVVPCCAKLFQRNLQEDRLEDCQSCFYSGALELNLFFNFTPSVIYEQLRAARWR